jgi:predicted metal-dependent hydrolase
MTTPDHYERAIATLGLPVDWQVIVAVRPRRRTMAIEIRPGGTVAVLVPPTVPPERVAAFVAESRPKIVDKVSAAVALAPDFAVTNLVQGERYDLLGRTHQLRLVADDRAGRTPRIDLDGSGEPVIVVRHGPPERIRRDIITLYQEQGLVWARQHGQHYERLGRIENLRYEVRDLGRRRWGVYETTSHMIGVHWATFGLPVHLIEYVLAHE